jgi:hypothetical protein
VCAEPVGHHLRQTRFVVAACELQQLIVAASADTENSSIA